MSSNRKYEKMWNAITRELMELSRLKYNEDLPEINLIIAIIVQAAKDRDLNYFASGIFNKIHCKCLRLTPDFIKKLMTMAWKVEDSDEDWCLPDQRVSESESWA